MMRFTLDLKESYLYAFVRLMKEEFVGFPRSFFLHLWDILCFEFFQSKKAFVADVGIALFVLVLNFWMWNNNPMV